jgi:hypothetical protein
MGRTGSVREWSSRMTDIGDSTDQCSCKSQLCEDCFLAVKMQLRGADPGPLAQSSEAPNDIDATRDGGGRRPSEWWGSSGGVRAVRWASHLIVWTLVLVPTLIEMSRGWRPLWDDATITSQSFRVFSPHPPLLGQYSTVSAGAAHTIFDPGPLQYVLLAIPTHLDTGQGSLLGAALICGIACTVAIEALWRTGRWLGCMAMAFCVADLAWLIPWILPNLVWNPYMGLLFTVGAIALALVVSLGHFRWWPVLVFVASVATQTEVFFATVTLSLVVVTPFLAALQSKWPPRRSWLYWGIGVGFVCWLVPVIQQFGGQFGNMSEFVRAGGREKALGLTEGLRSLAYPLLPGPIWLRSSSYMAFRELGTEPILCGALVIIGLSAVAVIAWRTRRKDLSALAGVGLVTSLGVVTAISGTPRAHVGSLTYLDPELWVIGTLIWIVAAWCVVELIGALIRHIGGGRWSGRKHQKVLGTIGMALASLVLVLVTVRALAQTLSSSNVDADQVTQMNKAVRVIENGVPPGPVVLRFNDPPGHVGVLGASSDAINIGSGIAWQLTAHGWEPSTPSYFPPLAAANAAVHRSDPVATVFMQGLQVVKVTIRR